MYLQPEAYIKIREETLEELHKRYPGQFIEGNPWDYIAIFPAKHEKVGELKLYQAIKDITYVIPYITHGHLSYPEDDTPEYAANYMKWSVVDFLEDLFNDNMLLAIDRDLTFSFAIPQCSVSQREGFMEPGVDYFVWSGPIPNLAEEKGRDTAVFRNKLNDDL